MALSGSSAGCRWIPKAVPMEVSAPETGSTDSRSRKRHGPGNRHACAQWRQDGGTGGTPIRELPASGNFESVPPPSMPPGIFPPGQREAEEDECKLFKLFDSCLVWPSDTSRGLHVKLSRCHLGDDSVVMLAAHIDDVLTRMEWSDKDGMWANLELDHNNMSDISLIDLVDVLSHHYVAIRRARLFNNSISDRGATRLASAIGQQDYALEEVHLSHNRLTARSLVAICLAVAAKRPAPGCNFPCWARLEHNRIAMPLKVLELLHHHAWVATCLAKNRNLCGPGRCARCVSGGCDDPRVHLFLLSSQRDEEGVYVDFGELRADISRWWNLCGKWKRTQAKAYVDELADAKTEQGAPSRSGRSGMPVLLGRSAAKQAPVLGDMKGTELHKNSDLAPGELKQNMLEVPLPPGFDSVVDLAHECSGDEASSSKDIPDASDSSSRKRTNHNKIRSDMSSASSTVEIRFSSKEPSEAADDDESTGGHTAGRMLLSILKTDPEDLEQVASRPDPQPLSTDEYQLWAMQAREDAELGADALNAETFGTDHGFGWSFEENLAANEQLTYRQFAELYGYQRNPPDVNVLRNALKEMGGLIQIQPWCLKESIRFIMADGWNNITWGKNYTALHLAAEFGQADAMPLLVALGAKPDDVDVKGRTAADVARKMNHWRCVSMLADLQSTSQVTPAATSAESGVDQAMVEGQQLFNAVREATRFMDLEPLCLREAMWHLIATGSSVIPWYDSAVLNLTCEFGRSEIMPLLFALRADPDAVDAWGRTALDVAYAKGNWACVHELQKQLKLVSKKPDDLAVGAPSKAGHDALVRLRAVPPPR